MTKATKDSKLNNKTRSQTYHSSQEELDAWRVPCQQCRAGTCMFMESAEGLDAPRPSAQHLAGESNLAPHEKAAC